MAGSALDGRGGEHRAGSQQVKAAGHVVAGHHQAHAARQQALAQSGQAVVRRYEHMARRIKTGQRPQTVNGQVRAAEVGDEL